ncbi:MAG TPA: tetratricopeptide repeat protein [Ignavibacteriaceae bacterium]|nr:tetratricopeptide repeat protein [Ignavibacteriaceae bacterium]
MKNKLILSVIFLFILSTCQQISAQINSKDLKIEAIGQMRVGRYGEAIDLLNRFISAEPQNPVGYNLRGLCYEKRSDYENSTYDYKSALKLEPSNDEYQKNLARSSDAWHSLLYNIIEGHKREIAINPNIPVNYLEIGKAYKRLGDWETAEEWYDKYLGREEASADEIIRYSEILAKNGHIAKGEPILRKYTEKYPDDHRLWSRYAYFTLWLGKRKTSIDAFEHSLALKPFFKEALDGLDRAKGKPYIYTINDTTVKSNYVKQALPTFEYPIDRYYRLLKRDPQDQEMRFKLVKSLVIANRYQEAKDQLKILLRDTSKAQLYNEYLSNVQSIMDSVYNVNIAKLKSQLEKDPDNVKIKLKLADYYTSIEQYDNAIPLYEDYIRAFPNNDQVRFKYAQVLSWNQLFDQSSVQIDELLIYDPDNVKYQLLRAQIAVWVRKDSALAQNYLDNILSKQPENVDALVAFSSLYMQKNDFEKAQNIIDYIKTLDPGNENIIVLQNDLELQKSRYEQEQLFAILYKARDLSYQNKCEEALPLYKEYMTKAQPNILITREYADVNVCAGHYEKAISLYNRLLAQNYDYDLAVQRAKTYYFMGDSINSLLSFQKLQKETPNDFVVNMYLGDSFVKMQEYGEARDIYNNILDNLNPDSSQTELIVQRKEWLPVTGFSGIPNYTSVSPYASYYSDNFGFGYFTSGLRIDFGLTQYLSVGVEGFRNSLESNSINANYNNIRWNLGLKLSDYVSLGVGLGSSFYSNSETKTIVNGFFRISDPEVYSVRLGYSKTDAALVVFSPSLVGTRENANTFTLNAYYLHKSGIRINTDVTYLTVPLDNSGLNAELRIGKYLFDNFILGYNFSSSNFARQVSEYYSPSGFASHSLFADWDILKDLTSTVTIGGRIGMISKTGIIIREIYAASTLSLARSFTLQGSLRLSSTAQNNFGYNSLSSYLSAYWAL